MATFVRTQEIEHEIGPTGQLALRVTSPDVEMRAVDSGIARVRATFEIRAGSDAEADEILDRVRLNVTEGPGSLDVMEPREGPNLGSLMRLLGGSGGKVQDVSVTVDAPRGCDLRYDGVSADLTATGFRGTQQYRTVSGDLVLEDVGGDLRVRDVSGDISLRASAPLPSLEINTVSGDVSAVAPRRRAAPRGDRQWRRRARSLARRRSRAPGRDRQRRLLVRAERVAHASRSAASRPTSTSGSPIAPRARASVAAT